MCFFETNWNDGWKHISQFSSRSSNFLRILAPKFEWQICRNRLAGIPNALDQIYSRPGDLVVFKKKTPLRRVLISSRRRASAWSSSKCNSLRRISNSWEHVATASALASPTQVLRGWAQKVYQPGNDLQIWMIPHDEQVWTCINCINQPSLTLMETILSATMYLATSEITPRLLCSWPEGCHPTSCGNPMTHDGTTKTAEGENASILPNMALRTRFFSWTRFGCRFLYFCLDAGVGSLNFQVIKNQVNNKRISSYSEQRELQRLRTFSFSWRSFSMRSWKHKLDRFHKRRTHALPHISTSFALLSTLESFISQPSTSRGSSVEYYCNSSFPKKSVSTFWIHPPTFRVLPNQLDQPAFLLLQPFSWGSSVLFMALKRPQPMATRTGHLSCSLVAGELLDLLVLRALFGFDPLLVGFPAPKQLPAAGCWGAS